MTSSTPTSGPGRGGATGPGRSPIRRPAGARAAVHSAAASPLGASDPRQEGPADLRLVPPALAAWGAAALALGMPGVVVAIGCAGAVLVAVALWWSVLRRRRPFGGPEGESARGPAARRRAAGPVTAVVTALLCAAAAGSVAGLQAAELRRGPVAALAGRYAETTVELTLTGDPSQVRPRVRGAATLPSTVVVPAETLRVTTVGGAVTHTEVPVLVVVHPQGRARAAWLGQLPSTRLRVTGRLAPSTRPGDRAAAVVRVRGAGPPHVMAGPTAAQRVAGRMRAGLREASDGLAPDARALLPGLVVGDTARIPPDLDDAFRATDLTHLLAVSGSNLTLVLTLLIGPPRSAARAERGGLAGRLGIPLRATALLGGGLTLAFVIVCRPEPSVLRAAACGLITLLAIGTGRRRALLPALAAAVLALVLYDPWLARSYGFLLSVLATGALLLIAPRWSAALRRRGVPSRLAEVLAAAAAAQAVCAPVIVVLAARVSLVAIPCNLLAELAVGPATVLGFAALAVAPLALPVARALAWLAGWPAEWIATVARTGAGLPGAEAGWPGGWSGGLLLAAATALAILLGRRLASHPRLCLAGALLLLVALVRPAPLARVVTGWPPPGWRMVACDVGQGDALVLAAGAGSAVVVDTGPEPRTVDRCLRDLGVDQIPLLVLTHFHADHVAGLAGAVRGRPVGAIQTTALAEPPGQAALVRRVARAARIPVITATPGERRRAGPLSWEVLWPPVGAAAARGGAPGGSTGWPGEGPNDASVTLLVRTGGLTLLLLGDLEPPAQRALLAAAPGLGPVDVLKVAHHGSAYQDPELLRRLRPRLAVVSCGADNPYGHPSPRTIAALRRQGAVVVRTDTDGPIAVSGAGAGLRASVRGGRRRVRGGRRRGGRSAGRSRARACTCA
ncbi:ComEC/Rec2 family competence protein [Streptomyces sp. LX-29]|uniref:ComEC/Rec2 family competence protein n=1 Tax=Streptomyces sp. LX-29 TaxID=2900152 RepID=UPI00240D947C|nr:ComEC/Rec2 family competence protein [Streptomyces sp. LX-29]WFB09635.1 ComEC/Rec2 family competence protein [Streptomyces sp. LX-29]